MEIGNGVSKKKFSLKFSSLRYIETRFDKKDQVLGIQNSQVNFTIS